MCQIIQGGTTCGGDLLVTNVGYHYTRKTDTRPGRSKRWCCTNRNRGCKATITEQRGTFNPGLQLQKGWCKFCIALPSHLYGKNIKNLTDDNIRELQKIENSVYRCILGAAHYNPNVALGGEICASLMRKRVINGRINNVKGIQRNRNELLESILWIIQTEQETKWIKTTRKYMKDVNINFNDIHQKSKEYLKQFLIKWDLNIWKAELEMKTTLQIYKNKIKITLVMKKFMTIDHHQTY